jgi:hypothetical protein
MTFNDKTNHNKLNDNSLFFWINEWSKFLKKVNDVIYL